MQLTKIPKTHGQRLTLICKSNLTTKLGNSCYPIPRIALFYRFLKKMLGLNFYGTKGVRLTSNASFTS